mmetsp:Transcript_11149/g.8681  ORF Transcript_11149/g.8681 Transcript_11149/m.8681 type:complete len:128 (-) Transcript_11149:98-481(-)
MPVATSGASPPTVQVFKPPMKPLLLFITNVKTARTVWVEISVNDNVEMLKNYVSRKIGVPVADMVLIYMGEELKNDEKMKECKLTRIIQKVDDHKEPSMDDCTIHLIDLKDTPAEVKEPPPPALTTS